MIEKRVGRIHNSGLDLEYVGNSYGLTVFLITIMLVLNAYCQWVADTYFDDFLVYMHPYASAFSLLITIFIALVFAAAIAFQAVDKTPEERLAEQEELDAVNKVSLYRQLLGDEEAEHQQHLMEQSSTVNQVFAFAWNALYIAFCVSCAGVFQAFSDREFKILFDKWMHTPEQRLMGLVAIWFVCVNSMVFALRRLKILAGKRVMHRPVM